MSPLLCWAQPIFPAEICQRTRTFVRETRVRCRNRGLKSSKWRLDVRILLRQDAITMGFNFPQSRSSKQHGGSFAIHDPAKRRGRAFTIKFLTRSRTLLSLSLSFAVTFIVRRIRQNYTTFSPLSLSCIVRCMCSSDSCRNAWGHRMMHQHHLLFSDSFIRFLTVQSYWFL